LTTLFSLSRNTRQAMTHPRYSGDNENSTN
jgi:hypothetical protein